MWYLGLGAIFFHSENVPDNWPINGGEKHFGPPAWKWFLSLKRKQNGKFLNSCRTFLAGTDSFLSHDH